MCDTIGFMDIHVEQQQQLQQQQQEQQQQLIDTNLISSNTGNNKNINKQEEENKITELSDACQRHIKKKAISFDLNDEKVQKFIAGKTIVDQSNPFRNDRLCNRIEGENKEFNKSILRKQDNKSNRNIRNFNEQLSNKNPPNEKSPLINAEFITTEEVLNQSKYVKTYIKNPDPYFKYDPTVLIRLKLEELKELALKRPPKKRGPCQSDNHRHTKYSKNIKYNESESNIKTVPLTYKKCSKANYPDLADLKIKIGAADAVDGLLNIDEIAENVRKFDERVKNLQFPPLIDDGDDDNDDNGRSDVDENNHIYLANNLKEESTVPAKSVESKSTLQKNSTRLTNETSFNKMIKSQDFQNYLKKSGLILQPKDRLDSNMNSTMQPTNKKIDASLKTQVQFDMEPKDNRKMSTVLRKLFPSRLFSSKSSRDEKPPQRLTYERRSYHGHTPTTHPIQDNNSQNHKEVPEISNTNKLPRRVPIRKLSEGEMRTSLTKRNESIKRQYLNRFDKQQNNRLPGHTIECSTSQSDDHYDTFKENIDWSKQKKLNNAPPAKKTGTIKINENLIESDESNNDDNVMPTSSTPIKGDTINETTDKESSLKLNSIPHRLEVPNDQKEWNKLRAIKEHTDRELYQQIMQHQHKLKIEKKLIVPNSQETAKSHRLVLEDRKENFIRNSPKRQSVPIMIHSSKHSNQRNVYMMNDNGNNRAMSTERLRRTVDAQCSRSDLDCNGYNHLQPKSQLKSENTSNTNNNRKIGGILTREDILQKLKEFCWKSQNGTFFKNRKPLAISPDEPVTQTGLSPVSYVSVETDQQSNFRTATPQSIPQAQSQRKHSLPLPPTRHGHALPHTQKPESVCESHAPSYAYVMKRNDRKQVNQCELNEKKDQRSRTKSSTAVEHFEKPHYRTAVQPIYVQQNTLQYPQNEFMLPVSQQQILVNGENVLVKPVQIINNFPVVDINSQYQYIKPQQQQLQLQLQHLQPNYCYIMVREPEIVHHQTALQPQAHLQIMPPIFYNNSPNVALERFGNANLTPINNNQMYQNSTFMPHHVQQQQQQQFWMPHQRINLV